MALGSVSRRALLGRLAVAALFGCVAPAAPAWAQQTGTLNIVATTAMIGDALRQIAGERASVTVLMGEGIDPHTYRQTRSDVVAMTRADAVFWHGLNLEAQLAEFLADLGATQAGNGAGGARLARQASSQDPAAPGKPDPHVWMDPRLWREVVIAARDELADWTPPGDQPSRPTRHATWRRSSAWRPMPSVRLSTVPPSLASS